MVRNINDHIPAATAVLSDEQFAKLVDILTPGYELSKLMLAQYQEHADAQGHQVDSVPIPDVVEQSPE